MLLFDLLRAGSCFSVTAAFKRERERERENPCLSFFFTGFCLIWISLLWWFPEIYLLDFSIVLNYLFRREREPVNPYHPTAPTDQEQQLGYRIAVAIADEFGLRKPVLRSPDYCHRLPAQKPSDYINCGVYVCLYMVIYAFGSLSKHYVGDLLPNTIGKCRLLVLAWILRGEIFFLAPSNK